MDDFMLQDGQLFLFQGDSITDCGRRGDAAPFGTGYASLVREMVTALYPDRVIAFMNRGIGGNTTTDLKERWDDDVIRHQPDWLSILIGINDIHRYLFNPDPGVQVSPELFREQYDWLLQRTLSETNARIVLLEPFYISLSSKDTRRAQVLELLPEYIRVVHDMAEKYDTLLVPLHQVFQDHLVYYDAETFCPEPVHPNRGGHILMAFELLKILGAIT